MASRARASAGLALLALATVPSCRSARTAVPLHYAAQPTEDFTDLAGGRLQARVGGLDVRVVLAPTAPHIELTVANPDRRTVRVRLGPQAVRDRTAAIGEVQHRPLGRPPGSPLGEGRSDFLPFLSMQDMAVEPQTEAVFYVDHPLGTEPAVGQYLVLVLEVDGAAGRDRRLLPLVVTNVGDPRR
ncbi:MAG: hypothetical protein AB7O97_18980 [Planctomycetota bacterium]